MVNSARWPSLQWSLESLMGLLVRFPRESCRAGSYGLSCSSRRTRVAALATTARSRYDPGRAGRVGRAFNEMTTARRVTVASGLHDRNQARGAAGDGRGAGQIATRSRIPMLQRVAHGLDLVRRRMGGERGAVHDHGRMHRATVRIQDAIQELLTFARPSAHARDRERDSVMQRGATGQPAAGRASVDIHVVVDPTQRASTRTREMVLQALVNLLMNAVEASPAGRAVTASVHGPVTRGVRVARITGRGIPSSDLETVFRPFYTTRHTGTGLKRPISRGVARRSTGNAVAHQHRGGRGTRAVFACPWSRLSIHLQPGSHGGSS